MEQCRADPCEYRKIVEGVMELILVLHRDYILVIEGKEACDELHHKLNENFLAENLGELKWYLGCALERDLQQSSLPIKQPAMIEQGFHATHVYEITLKEDNEGAKAMAENPLSSGRS